MMNWENKKINNENLMFVHKKTDSLVDQEKFDELNDFIEGFLFENVKLTFLNILRIGLESVKKHPILIDNIVLLDIIIENKLFQFR